MRRNNTVSPLLWAALTLPVLYLAALLASGYEEGMTVFDLMGHFGPQRGDDAGRGPAAHRKGLCYQGV